jgi:hypothetical protein
MAASELGGDDHGLLRYPELHPGVQHRIGGQKRFYLGIGPLKDFCLVEAA